MVLHHDKTLAELAGRKHVQLDERFVSQIRTHNHRMEPKTARNKTVDESRPERNFSAGLPAMFLQESAGAFQRLRPASTAALRVHPVNAGLTLHFLHLVEQRIGLTITTTTSGRDLNHRTVRVANIRSAPTPVCFRTRYEFSFRLFLFRFDFVQLFPRHHYKSSVERREHHECRVAEQMQNQPSFSRLMSVNPRDSTPPFL